MAEYIMIPMALATTVTGALLSYIIAHEETRVHEKPDKTDESDDESDDADQMQQLSTQDASDDSTDTIEDDDLNNPTEEEKDDLFGYGDVVSDEEEDPSDKTIEGKLENAKKSSDIDAMNEIRMSNFKDIMKKLRGGGNNKLKGLLTFALAKKYKTAESKVDIIKAISDKAKDDVNKIKSTLKASPRTGTSPVIKIKGTDYECLATPKGNNSAYYALMFHLDMYDKKNYVDNNTDNKNAVQELRKCMKESIIDLLMVAHYNIKRDDTIDSIENMCKDSSACGDQRPDQRILQYYGFLFAKCVGMWDENKNAWSDRSENMSLSACINMIPGIFAKKDDVAGCYIVVSKDDHFRPMTNK